MRVEAEQRMFREKIIWKSFVFEEAEVVALWEFGILVCHFWGLRVII